MANNKVGLAYYSVDTDRYQDNRIKRLKKDFGCSGIAVYDYILCEIYRVKGCFIMWDESTAFDVADYFNIKETLVNEIVAYCGVVGLFNKELLARERVLTSHSIQMRYIDMCVRAKRKGTEIPKSIKIIQEESAKLPEESPKVPEQSIDSSVILPQSKVKESKVKKKDNIHLNSPSDEFVNDETIPIPVPFELKLSLELPKRSLELAEQNQYLHTRKKNTGFIKSQWKLFLSEQMQKTKYYGNMGDLTGHFLNWMRPKFPKFGEVYSPEDSEVFQNVKQQEKERNAQILGL